MFFVGNTEIATATGLSDYLSSTYGEKWVRLSNANGTSQYACYYSQVSSSDVYYCHTSTDITTDADASLWCIVGTADNCKLYNKKMGESYALGTASSSYADGVFANLYPSSSSNVCSWHIADYTSMTKGGYAFLPYGNSTYAFNMYGGESDENRYLRLYNYVGSDAGNNWNFTLVDTSGGETTTTDGNEDNIDGTRQVLYQNLSTYYPWRIPSIARAYNGDLIALGGYLGCGTDIGWGRCDVYGRISNDNGGTWGDKFAIAVGTGTLGVRTSGTVTTKDLGYGDAAIVADRTSNKVLIMSCTGGYSYSNSTRTSDLSTVLRTARYYGNYDESTGSWSWTTPVDVTSTIYGLLPNVDKLFVGSGKICQSSRIKVGDYYRVYIALCTNKGNFVLYSDNFGETWNNLGSGTTSCAENGDEPKCEELPNGNVLLSSRKASGRCFNIFTYTNQPNAAGSWGSQTNWYQTINGLAASTSATNGEILLVDAIRKSDNTPVTIALQSVPTGSARNNVSVFYKELSSTSDYDTPAHFAASDWDGVYQVSSTTSAYSTMCKQADNRIAFFFEENYTTAVKYGDGYDLVYYRYPLETITGNKYSMVFEIPDAQTYNVSTHSVVADKVTYNRSNITSAGTYTVCLPFSLTAEQAKTYGITKIEKFTNADANAGTVTFSNVDAMDAFTPYVVTCNANALASVSLTDATINKLPTDCSTTVNGFSFTGNFKHNKTMVGLFGYKADGTGFAKGTTNAYINAFRSYISAPTTYSAKVCKIIHDGTTGICRAATDEAELIDVYTIDGCKIRHNVHKAQALKGLQSGIYIVNHKKVVIE